MTLAEMITAVRKMSGDVDSAQYSDSEVIQWLNWGQTEIVNRLEMNLKDVTNSNCNSATLTGGVLLPDDMLRVVALYWNSTRLIQMPFRDIYPHSGANPASQIAAGNVPSHYAISPWMNLTRVAIMYPYVSLAQAGPIRVEYIGQPTAMAAAPGTCPLPVWLHETLCLYGVMKARQTEENDQAAAFIDRDINMRLARFYSYMTENEFGTHPEMSGDAPVLQYFDRI